MQERSNEREGRTQERRNDEEESAQRKK